MHIAYLFLFLPVYALALRFVGSWQLKKFGKFGLSYKIQASTVVLISCFVPFLIAATNSFSHLEKWFGWFLLPVIIFAIVWLKAAKEKCNET